MIVVEFAANLIFDRINSHIQKEAGTFVTRLQQVFEFNNVVSGLQEACILRCLSNSKYQFEDN